MKTDLIYGVEDRPPFKDALFAALQHLLAIFVAIITPPLIIASALKLDVENVESGEDGIHKVESETDSKEKFQIIESEKEEGEIFVSPDIAICPECKKELYDKNDRRYLHPFINCTCCGPRRFHAV